MNLDEAIRRLSHELLAPARALLRLLMMFQTGTVLEASTTRGGIGAGAKFASRAARKRDAQITELLRMGQPTDTWASWDAGVPRRWQGRV